MNKIILLYIFFLLPNLIFSNRISKAYYALSIYDYFKAKKLFYKSQKKDKVASSYGLALIYYRTDNPFSNIDSAAKYISNCPSRFTDSLKFKNFTINKKTIQSLKYEIGNKGYEKYCKNADLKSVNHYLVNFQFAKSGTLNRSYFLRDSVYFQKLSDTQSSDSVNYFILKYPESALIANARVLFDEFEYTEITNVNDVNSYKRFIKQFPKNRNVYKAEQTLFSITQQLKNEDSLYQFISKYATSNTKEFAWKYLYGSVIKKYSKQNLEAFIVKYPDYPFKDFINKEMELTEFYLLPLKNSNSKFGYVDTLGNWVIPAIFDDAMPFTEGFANVCKNDSCYYINKEGLNVFNGKFSEIYNFKNGLAIVQNNAHFYLINRIGQIISKPYNEINSPSDNLYVCKDGDKYGAINTKAEVVIPFEYNKLGDFINGYAYYYSSMYGLVNWQNNIIEAEWNWVSNVDSNSIFIVKKGDKYGLINTLKSTVLNIEFDYIKQCENGIYLVVKNNYYGFYNGLLKCFATSIDYNYNTSYETSYYTNGKHFKLFKNGNVAVVDANGKYIIPFETYTDIFFAKCDVIRIQKNNKFGYVDKKLKPITGVEFEKASDFEDNVAIVQKGLNTQLVNINGTSIFTIKNGEIEKINEVYYKTFSENELEGLINTKGVLLLPNQFKSIEFINNNFFRCEKPNDHTVYLYNAMTHDLKKIE